LFNITISKCPWEPWTGIYKSFVENAYFVRRS
jgi:hypothetical protein